MPDKEQRAAQAAKHVALMRNVFADEIAASAAGTVIFQDGDGREIDIPEPQFDRTETSVTTAFAIEALFSTRGKAVVIDPGGFTKPAGNYLEGGWGPEQVLCSKSNLYPILHEIRDEFHEKNRGWESGLLFTDRAAYIPKVVFSHEGTTRMADVVVIAAPNRTRALENNRSPEGCDQALGFRIEAMMRVAASHGATTLVCGAFGCGVFGNDDGQVADLIAGWLDAHPGVFERVVFAVPPRNFAAFDARFGHRAPAEEPIAAPEENEDESWRDIELPEGVTLR